MTLLKLYALVQLADAHPLAATACLLLFIAIGALCIRILSDLEATHKIPSALRIAITTMLCLIVAGWIGWQVYHHSVSPVEDPTAALRSLK